VEIEKQHNSTGKESWEQIQRINQTDYTTKLPFSYQWNTKLSKIKPFDKNFVISFV
jgi:hypothetical protein